MIIKLFTEKITLIIILAVVCIIPFAGCELNDVEEDTLHYSMPLPVDVTNDSLSGTWQTECIDDEDNPNPNNKIYIKRTMIFSGNDFDLGKVMLLDCDENPFYKLRITGTYELGNEIINIPKAKKAIYKNEHVYITFFIDSLVDAANSDNLFGFSNWENGVEKDITVNNGGTVETGEVKDIFRIMDNNKFYYGDGDGQLDSDGYPATLHETDIYTKQ